ncbi:hypothetical protein SAMN04488112_103143 [Melghirimyces thermohalophilus]|uniref:Uncharacterized protein n=1 Tax=Melghirimyces thermohalophilus TaxID=1236220 RepID=A0A1G6J3Z9_9BACL|nr:hypothetical protein [Melghirimyces thermohalophilus]SDC12676.1 hypothetical protein SAMN04488112_103143 [Melghirimyces thermohalophilus]
MSFERRKGLDEELEQVRSALYQVVDGKSSRLSAAAILPISQQ